MATHKKMKTVRETTTIVYDEEELRRILACHVGKPDADVIFDISSGGWLRGAEVSWTNESTEEVK